MSYSPKEKAAYLSVAIGTAIAIVLTGINYNNVTNNVITLDYMGSTYHATKVLSANQTVTLDGYQFKLVSHPPRFPCTASTIQVTTPHFEKISFEACFGADPDENLQNYSTMLVKDKFGYAYNWKERQDYFVVKVSDDTELEASKLQQISPTAPINTFSETIPIPNAKIWQSSYYGYFPGPIPTSSLCPSNSSISSIDYQKFLKEVSNTTLPSPIYFSQYLTTDRDGVTSAKTMFGRVYVCQSGTNNFLGNSTVLLLKKGETADVTLKLHRSGAIVGKVHDKQGNPIPGIYVEASSGGYYDKGYNESCEGSNKSDISGYDGTFVITNLLDGCSYRMSAYEMSYADYSYWFLNPQFQKEELDNKVLLRIKEPVHEPRFAPKDVGKVAVEKGKMISLDITVEPDEGASGMITGRVRDSDGNPIANIFVDAMGPYGSPFARGVTDSAGNFAIRNVWPETYKVSASVTGLYAVDPEFVVKKVSNVAVYAGKEARIPDIIAVPSAKISGKIVLSDGTPIQSVGIHISPILIDKGYDYWPSPNVIANPIIFYYERMVTDSEGRYNITKALPPGRYEISILPVQIKLHGKLLELEPKTLIVDAYSGKETKDANLILDYKVIEDYGKYRSVKFYGYVKDNEGHPLAHAAVRTNTIFQSTGFFQTETDDNGFYSLIVTEKDVPETSNLKWTVVVDTSKGASIPQIGLSSLDENIPAVYEDKKVKDVVLDWGQEKQIDFTLQKLTINELPTGKINVRLYGEPPRYSLPSKSLVLTADYNGKKYDVQIITNSTLVGSWIDLHNNSLGIEIDPIAGTYSRMDITMPKDLINGIQRVLFDGQDRQVAISSNATHTKISMSYYQDVNRIEIMATQVIPEFPFALVVLATSTTGLIVALRFIRKAK